MGKTNKVLKGLTIEIGGDTTKLGKALEGVEKKSSDLSGELKQINNLLKFDPKNTELLAQKQKVLADAIKNTESKLGTLKEAEKQVQAQFERGEVSEEQYRALRREIVAAEGMLDKYKQAAKETAEAEKKLADGADKAGKELDDAGDSSSEAGSKFNAAAASAAALTASVIALGKASVDAFNEVDDGADNVIRATGATGFAAEQLSASYKKVASQVVGSFEDIGATVGEVNTRFGYTGKQLENCSVDFMKFAEITGVNSTEAVKSVTRALNDSGIPLEEYKTLLDQLAKAGQAAGIDVTKLAEGLSTNGATMRSMGLDTAESIALLAQFELSGADATTMLSGMKKAMATWAKEGKDGSEEFEKLCEGVKTGSVSAADALDVFGTRAGPQLVDAIQSGKFEYKDMLQVLRQSQGTLEATFGELEDGGYSADRSFQRLKVVVSDLGEEILEGAAPALEDFVDYLEDSGAVKALADTVKNRIIPALKSIASWTSKNGPVIKSTLTGAAAAMAAYNVATIATKVSQQGLKKSIAGTTVAQKALNVVQKASPMGIAVTAVTALTAGLIALNVATKNAKKPAYELTEEEKKLRKAAEEAAEAFREQHEATEESFGNITAEMTNVQDLADELKTLADESGHVQEKDQARADLILGRLNEALGTEYKQVDGLIQGYDDLKESIDQVILSKTANALLEAGNADYMAAIQGQTDAYNNKQTALKELNAARKAEAEALREYAALQEEARWARENGRFAYLESLDAELTKAEDDWIDAQKATEAEVAEYEKAQAHYDALRATIDNYNYAQEEALKGNYQAAVDIFSRKGELYTEYSNTVDEETGKVLATLQKEAEDAYLNAKLLRENYEKGVAGVDEAAVTEAEEAYNAALGAWASAYSEANGAGANFGQGLADGITGAIPMVKSAAIKQALDAVSAVKKVLSINSPSKKTMAIGESFSEGTEIGIEKTTPNVVRSARDQVAAVIEAYQTPASTGQQVFRNIAEQQSARLASSQLATASTGPMLERILSAIEKGQVIALDGDVIVGATADRMDNALGLRRILATRGAT